MFIATPYKDRLKSLYGVALLDSRTKNSPNGKKIQQDVQKVLDKCKKSTYNIRKALKEIF